MHSLCYVSEMIVVKEYRRYLIIPVESAAFPPGTRQKSTCLIMMKTELKDVVLPTLLIVVNDMENLLTTFNNVNSNFAKHCSIILSPILNKLTEFFPCRNAGI